MVLSTDAYEKGKDCEDKVPCEPRSTPWYIYFSIQFTTSRSHYYSDRSSKATYNTSSACTAYAISLVLIALGHCSKSPSEPATLVWGWVYPGNLPYQHPEGRALPTTFHRGLSTHAPIVNVSVVGVSNPHHTITFNKGTGNVKEKLEKRIIELEAQKKAVAEAEAAATGKGKSPKVVPTVI